MKHQEDRQNSKATRHCLKLLKTLTKQNLKVIKLAQKLVKTQCVKWDKEAVKNKPLLSEVSQEASHLMDIVQPKTTSPKRIPMVCHTRLRTRESRIQQQDQILYINEPLTTVSPLFSGSSVQDRVVDQNVVTSKTRRTAQMQLETTHLGQRKSTIKSKQTKKVSVSTILYNKKSQANCESLLYAFRNIRRNPLV